MKSPELREIQAWLHTFVVEPGDQRKALQAAERKAGFDSGSAEELILPSPTLTPRERIQIYRGMYLLRMAEALEIDFPSIVWYVGQSNFKKLVSTYVENYPSQSYTLDHLGRHFADFLAEYNWNSEGKALSSLARLEWSMCVVAVAHDCPSLSMADLASAPEEEFLNMRFQPIKALELHTFQHNVNEVYKAWIAEEPPIVLTDSEIHLVCWRHELKVWRMELNDAAFCFLRCLCQGLPLGRSIDSTLESHNDSEETLFGWFQNWVGEGFFTSLTWDKATLLN
jgi:hypothetical protein